MPNAIRSIGDFMGDRMDVMMFGAVRDGVTDCLSAFNSAVASLPRGGTLVIPPGRYYLSATWTLDKPLVVLGAGDGMDDTDAPTALIFAAGQSGIVVSNPAGRSDLRNFVVKSQSTEAGSDVGVSVLANGVVLRQLTVRGFGSSGIESDTTSGVNANSCDFVHCRAFYNYGNGFFITGINSNQFRFAHCTAMWNHGWGFYTTRVPAGNFVFNTTFDACHCETNDLGSYYDNASDSIYINPYAEPDGPVGVCDVSGTAVTRVSGAEFKPEWEGIALQLGGSGYGTVVASIGDVDNLVLASAPGDDTGVAFMIRINQRAELGPDSQYSSWTCGTTNLNAPFIVPINKGFYSGTTDNGTHQVLQFGRFMKRLLTRGDQPYMSVDDTTTNPTGVCDVSGVTVTRISGDAFTVAHPNSLITIEGSDYLITAFPSADTFTLATSPGTLTGVVFTIKLSRTYGIGSGSYAAGSLSISDSTRGEHVLAYSPWVGWVCLKRFSIHDILPLFRLADLTPTTGRIYSFRNGFSGGGIFSLYDENAGEDVLIYDAIGQRWTTPKALRFTHQYDSVPDPGNPNEMLIGAGGTTPKAATVCWGDNSGWELQFGTSATGFAKRFAFTDQGRFILRYGAVVLDGSGDPEGAVTAPVGSVYLRTGGGTGTTLYVKESGTGNTGWAAMATNTTPAAFTDRGDPAGADLDQTSVTIDSAFHDWDLSGVIPAGSTAVLVRAALLNSSAAGAIALRKKGHTNALNNPVLRSGAAGQTATADLWVACDTNRVVQYAVNNVGSYTAISLVVAGSIK